VPDSVLTDTKSRRLLDAYIQARPETAQPRPFAVTRRPAGTALPLTPAQRQLWLHARMEADSPLYNEPLAVRYAGILDPAALERSFTEIVRRHEAWRTTFQEVEGQAVQVIQEPFQVTLPVQDLRELPAEQRESAATSIATGMARVPFDLARGPLFRAALVRVADEDYRLFVTLHHLIFDGFSGYRVFLPELSALYKGYSQGKPLSLPELPYQFGDYAVWQEKRMDGHELDRGLDYWKHQLAGPLPVLELPIARSRSAPRSFRGAVRSLTLPASLSAALRRLGQQEGATLFMTLVAAFNVLLHRYSGQEDVLIGTNTAGRNCPGSEKLLGYFLNTVVLRTDLSGSPTFRQVLERVRQVTLDALAHDDVPLDRLVAELQPQRDLNRNPFFQVLFSLEPPVSCDQAEWDLTCIDVETGTTKFELCLVVDDRADGLLCRFIYSTDLFDDVAISRMQGHWRTLLDAVVAEPERRIGELSPLTKEERHQVVVQWNDTASPRSQALVHQLFEAHARQTPHALAVECGGRRLSYGELNQQADKLARALLSMGVGPDVAVAVCVERSVEMIIGILGVLKAGGAYVPLDPTYPRERLEYMLADCKAAVLLTQSSLTSNRLSRDIRTIVLDSDQRPNPETTQQSAGANLQSLAYIIYTSGSTGVPKGVLVTHDNLAHSNQARLHYYEKPVGSFLLLSSYAFDSSIAGIFHSLTSGGALVIPPLEFRWEPKELARLMAKNQISHVLSVPSLYAELLDHAEPAQLASLQTVIVAGETCPRQLVNSHYRVLPHTSLFNEYGPTEATVWSSVYECEPGQPEDRVPIGRPIANTQLYVLDRNRRPLPAGVAGELYIGGDGVTKGYFNRPDLTGDSFVPNPFANHPEARLYRTGDLARYLPDGNLEFLGRLDQQVKIRGLRVEVGEVETILAQHPDVREAAVLAHSNGSSGLQLSAYVIVREPYATSSSELRSFLKSRLPAYGIPAAFHFVNAFPRTPNGKVDRQRLLLSQANAGEAQTVPVTPPGNDVEKRLLAIWQLVLNTDTQDVTRDFFEMGGHSLLAAKLLAQIEKEFGKSLSLAFVFQSPTIQQMAESLRTAGQSLRERAIVPIQAQGSRLPLFWVRGGPRFRLLAQKLGPDQPFLGLDLPYMDCGKLPVPYSLEDIAALLVQAMREEQPHGPYHIAGLCVNAVLAYEIARQLVQSGEEVALLALLDGHNQAYYKNPFMDGRYSSRIKYHLSNLRQLDARDTSRYLLDRLDEARRKIERITWQLTSNRNEAGMHNTDNIVHPAFHRYEPQPYAGKMVLLQSSDWPSGPYFDFKMGWNDLVSEGIEFHWIPGDHPSMFTEPNVNLVAEKLRAHLAEPSQVVNTKMR
jgi:surfactin family lipopeptide synthetase A